MLTIGTLLVVILAAAFLLLAFIVFDINFQVVLNAAGTRRYSYLIGFILLLCAALTIGVSYIITRIQLKPLRQLQAGMKALANGEFSYRLDTAALTPNEFHELHDCFNIMAIELESTELLRRDFINSFSHEFKTPIVSIRGFAKILQSKTSTPQQEEEYIKIIVDESERLSKLSQNVLNLCKVENQTILSHTEQYNLAEQIRQTILSLQNQWEQKKLDFELNIEDISFTCNRELMGQLWLNLIDNAIKFSPGNSTILVLLKEKSNHIIFSITDYGVGIDDADQKWIFDKFYQCDTSHAIQGNGIGLSIVKRVAEMHGGKVAVTSRIGEGSTFTVTLPRR
jgi:signal transduction histidine kinase